MVAAVPGQGCLVQRLRVVEVAFLNVVAQVHVGARASKRLHAWYV